MEKIANVGWFLTNEEMAKIVEAYELLGKIIPRPGCEEGLAGDNGGTIPYTTPDAPEKNKPCDKEYGSPCPNCPFNQPYKLWWDWTWRPWQAPWYGPGEAVPTDWKIGDGEWWKHHPYCTSTTEDKPNTVKDTRTNGQDNAFKWQ